MNDKTNYIKGDTVELPLEDYFPEDVVKELKADWPPQEVKCGICGKIRPFETIQTVLYYSKPNITNVIAHCNDNQDCLDGFQEKLNATKETFYL